tara:strand:+ start:171 stop:590 length:420 start_codon:yes stop_codon:yes gene_type:complete
MADITLKVGQSSTHDLKLRPADATQADGISLYVKPFASGYTASMVIRRKAGNSFNGPLIDTLSSEDSGVGANRINLLISSSTSLPAAGPNIQLVWTTADSLALPNETATVYGTLKIKKTSTSQVEHSRRISFEIKPEIK